jgi:hypothetical protein
MQIDESDEQPKNAELSMQQSLEPYSNESDKRDWQSQKQYWEMVVTEDGTHIRLGRLSGQRKVRFERISEIGRRTPFSETTLRRKSAAPEAQRENVASESCS